MAGLFAMRDQRMGGGGSAFRPSLHACAYARRGENFLSDTRGPQEVLNFATRHTGPSTP